MDDHLPALDVTTPLDRGAPLPPAADALPRGTSVGRYLIVDRLGIGGMGVVYAAYDPDLNRKIAIKLLRTPSKRPESTPRLRMMREAQAMARLSHPNVIAVFDVGTALDQLFLAMEYIEGGTLTEWLKRKPRSQREIVKMFIKAGRGLLAAHAAGLVHRDFKPDNVLVGKDGRVLVTDFGLVRSVHQDEAAAEPAGAPPPAGEAAQLPAAIGTAPTQPPAAIGTAPTQPHPAAGSPAAHRPLSTPLTRTGIAVGTLRFMAPEQLACEPLDPRTDQFSFCVALYEACYGLSPFTGATPNERLGSILNTTPPPPPGKRLPKGQHQALLRGLHPTPQARYPTMRELISELQAGLVKARWRWLAVVVAAVAVAAGLWLGYQRGRAVEPVCQSAANKRNTVWDYPQKRALHAALLAADAAAAPAIWQRITPLLDDYAKQWAAMSTDACQAALVRGVQSPRLYAVRMRCLDRRLEEMTALYDLLLTGDRTAIRRAPDAIAEFTPVSACADLQALSAPTPMPDSPQERERIRTLEKSIAQIRAFGHTGKYSEVIARAQAAVRTAQQIGYPPTLAEAQFLLAKVLFHNGAYDHAEREYLTAAATALEGNDPHTATQAFTALLGLAGVRGHYADAALWEPLARAALMGVPVDDDVRIKQLLYSCQNATALRLFDEAADQCQQAFTLSQQLYGPDSPNNSAVLIGLAALDQQQDRLEAALPRYQLALKYDEQRLGPRHPTIAATLRHIATVYYAESQYQQAIQYCLDALAIDQQNFGPTHRKLSDSLHLLATLYAARGEYDAALQHARRALALNLAAADATRSSQAAAHSALGDVLYRAGQAAEALAHHQEALGLFAFGRDELQVMRALLGLAEDLLAMKQAEQAQPLLAWVLRISAADPNLLARAQFAQARTLWSLDRERNRAQSQELARRAHASYKKLGRQTHRERAEVSAWLTQNDLGE